MNEVIYTYTISFYALYISECFIISYMFNNKPNSLICNIKVNKKKINKDAF